MIVYVPALGQLEVSVIVVDPGTARFGLVKLTVTPAGTFTAVNIALLPLELQVPGFPIVTVAVEIVEPDDRLDCETVADGGVIVKL